MITPLTGDLWNASLGKKKQECRVWHENYLINRGKLERLAREGAHGWDK